MRCELIIDNESVGKFDFTVAPKEGDGLDYKGESFTVNGFRHNLDKNKLTVLCKPDKSQPRRAPQRPVATPVVPESEVKKDD